MASIFDTLQSSDDDSWVNENLDTVNRDLVVYTPATKRRKVMAPATDPMYAQFKTLAASLCSFCEASEDLVVHEVWVDPADAYRSVLACAREQLRSVHMKAFSPEIDYAAIPIEMLENPYAQSVGVLDCIKKFFVQSLDNQNADLFSAWKPYQGKQAFYALQDGHVPVLPRIHVKSANEEYSRPKWQEQGRVVFFTAYTGALSISHQTYHSNPHTHLPSTDPAHSEVHTATSILHFGPQWLGVAFWETSRFPELPKFRHQSGWAYVTLGCSLPLRKDTKQQCFHVLGFCTSLRGAMLYDFPMVDCNPSYYSSAIALGAVVSNVFTDIVHPAVHRLLKLYCMLFHIVCMQAGTKYVFTVHNQQMNPEVSKILHCAGTWNKHAMSLRTDQIVRKHEQQQGDQVVLGAVKPLDVSSIQGNVMMEVIGEKCDIGRSVYQQYTHTPVQDKQDAELQARYIYHLHTSATTASTGHNTALRINSNISPPELTYDTMQFLQRLQYQQNQPTVQTRHVQTTAQAIAITLARSTVTPSDVVASALMHIDSTDVQWLGGNERAVHAAVNKLLDRVFSN